MSKILIKINICKELEADTKWLTNWTLKSNEEIENLSEDKLKDILQEMYEYAGGFNNHNMHTISNEINEVIKIK